MATDEIRRVKRAGDDYYKILGVDRDAGDDAIKKAYRKLALRLHPDKCSEEGAEEAFKRVGEAFGVLSDGDKRRVYDQCGVQGLRGGGGGGGGPDISPEDLFAAFFGGMQPGAAFHTGGMGPGVTTFSFGGPGMFHFSSGPMGGPMGGMRFQQAGQRRRPAPQQRPPPQEEEDTAETPPWLKTLQAIAQALGPMLPMVAMFVFFVGMVIAKHVLRFIMSRFVVVMPILYLTEGDTRKRLLAGVIVLGLLGFL